MWMFHVKRGFALISCCVLTYCVFCDHRSLVYFRYFVFTTNPQTELDTVYKEWHHSYSIDTKKKPAEEGGPFWHYGILSITRTKTNQCFYGIALRIESYYYQLGNSHKCVHVIQHNNYNNVAPPSFYYTNELHSNQTTMLISMDNGSYVLCLYFIYFLWKIV